MSYTALQSRRFTPSTTQPASAAQVGFIRSLLVKIYGPNAATLGTLPEGKIDNLTKAQASEVINRLKATTPLVAAAPVAATTAAPERVTEVGMYRNAAGDIFKVQKSKQSGNLYAKALVQIGGKRMVDDTEEVVSFEFQYSAGAVYGLTPAMRMSLEDAKAFGIRYGVCCVCGITLKDATSVALGIGPVCGGRV